MAREYIAIQYRNAIDQVAVSNGVAATPHCDMRGD